MINWRIVRNRLLVDRVGGDGRGSSRWWRLIQVGTEIDRWIVVGETLTSLLENLLWIRPNAIAHRRPTQDFRGLVMAVPTDRRGLLGAKAHACERVLELPTKLAYRGGGVKAKRC